MTSAFGPGDPGSGQFDDFLARFLGGASPRGAQRIDITALMTEQARGLVGAAAQQAAERGNTDLDAWHLLLAGLAVPPLRALIAGTGTDVEELARHADAQLPRGEATGQAPTLTPTAKRTLLDAHQNLARPRGQLHRPRAHRAGARRQPRLPGRQGPAVPRGGPAVAAALGVRCGPAERSSRSARAAGRERHPDHRPVRCRPDRQGPRGRAGPGDRARGRGRPDPRGPLPAHQEQPGADRRGRRRQDRRRRGHRPAHRLGRGARAALGQADRPARPHRHGGGHPLPR